VAQLNILYEDNHLLVAEKPYGMLSQADSTGDDDMLTLLKAYIKQKYGKPGDVYLGLVHRLDRPTAGVMVFARTSKAAARLAVQIKSNDFAKTYLAVLSASPKSDSGTLIHFLVKDTKEHKARVADKDARGAKYAELVYEVLEKKDGLCLVRVKLLTGRFHQIRAQFAQIGCGIYGDMKYGRRDIKERLALFAYEVCVNHPTRGERMCFSLMPRRYPFSIFDACIKRIE
jgi:23S rRNA pseudouridine1911/1915/1917 synthase